MIGSFLRESVKENTAAAYERDWKSWCLFLKEELRSADGLLTGFVEEDKAPIVALFLRSRHEAGMRGRGASGVTAGIRLKFTESLLPTAFMDSPIVTAAREACELTSAESRTRRDNGPRFTVKLPLCESILLEQRGPLWSNQGWDYPAIDQRALYIAAMWAFDMGARVSEYTAPEGKAEDHCVRAGDLLFDGDGPEGPFTVRGGDDYFVRARANGGQMVRFLGCWALPVSQKTGEVVKTKFIGRRTPNEVQFLGDLTEWVVNSGVTPSEELFSRCVNVRGKPSRKRLMARAIRSFVKKVAEEAGLDPRYFSAHSLRKATITHMRAVGASMDDMRDRANYAGGSEMPRTTYDYSSLGHGALSSSAIGGGVAPGVRDIGRYLYSTVEAPGGVGGGVPP